MKLSKKGMSIVAAAISVLSFTNISAQTSEQHPDCMSADSDSDGDGWGWENNVSCRVVATQTQTRPVCSNADSDSDGDGWGFEGGVSCVVENSLAQSQSVSDIPPNCTSAAIAIDEQGWGWENDATCIEPGTFAESVFGISSLGTDFPDADGDDFVSIPFRINTSSLAPESAVTYNNDGLNVNIVHEDPSGSARARYTVRPIIQDVDMLAATAMFLERPQEGFLRFEIGADLFNVTTDGGPEPGARTDNVEVEIEMALGATPDQDNWGYCLKIRRFDGVSDPLLGEGNECPGYFEQPLDINTGYTMSVAVNRARQDISITLDDESSTYSSPFPIFQASAADNHYAQFRVRDGASMGSFTMSIVEINGSALDLSEAIP